MTKKIGMVMDPIQNIHIYYDTSFAILLEAQRRQWELYYMEQHHLSMVNGIPTGTMYKITVKDDLNHWFDLGEKIQQPLTELDIIFMRPNPPVDMRYIYTTHILELAQRQGVLVINHPQSLRDANEKLYAAWFPQCCPPTVISYEKEQIHDFINQHEEVVLKPIHGMGGMSIFYVKKGDHNINVIIETLTHYGQQPMVAQRYLPELRKTGDKRIVMIAGKPYPYALARIPAKGEIRANLAAGGTGTGVLLTEGDKWICDQIGPTLLKKGLILVGIDVIGEYLTEINVTSPTGLRVLDRICNDNLCGILLDSLQ